MDTIAIPNKYQKYVKQNPEKMIAESNRIKNYLNDKYKNNEDYRLARITYQREYRKRMKENKTNI